jgi:hypothetical protein
MHEPSAFQPLGEPRPALGRGERVAGWAAGLLFVALGIAVLLGSGDMAIGPRVAGAALIGLGAQALWATARGRRSWLVRIGPLP